MLLSADQEMIRDAVREFAQRELCPHAARWDKERHFNAAQQRWWLESLATATRLTASSSSSPAAKLVQRALA